jgi:hypothetical protein
MRYDIIISYSLNNVDGDYQAHTFESDNPLYYIKANLLQIIGFIKNSKSIISYNCKDGDNFMIKSIFVRSRRITKSIYSARPSVQINKIPELTKAVNDIIFQYGDLI